MSRPAQRLASAQCSESNLLPAALVSYIHCAWCSEERRGPVHRCDDSAYKQGMRRSSRVSTSSARDAYQVAGRQRTVALAVRSRQTTLLLRTSVRLGTRLNRRAPDAAGPTASQRFWHSPTYIACTPVVHCCQLNRFDRITHEQRKLPEHS